MFTGHLGVGVFCSGYARVTRRNRMCPIPPSSWRFPPFRCRLLFISPYVVRLSAVRLVSWSAWPAHIVIIRLISDLPVTGRHSASVPPSTRRGCGFRLRLRLRLRLVCLVSSFRLKGSEILVLSGTSSSRQDVVAWVLPSSLYSSYSP